VAFRLWEVCPQIERPLERCHLEFPGGEMLFLTTGWLQSPPHVSLMIEATRLPLSFDFRVSLPESLRSGDTKSPQAVRLEAEVKCYRPNCCRIFGRIVANFGADQYDVAGRADFRWTSAGWLNRSNPLP
jgi:hypothetical protein